MLCASLVAAWLGSANSGHAAAPYLIDEVGRYPFEDLGWAEDVMLTSETPSAELTFRLPDGAEQGGDLWYGVYLSYEWIGNPGEVGDYAFLRGRWNGSAFYQLKVKRVTDLDEGFQWSMADVYNGASVGYEVGSRFAGASSNVAQMSSIEPGLNELRISLGLLDASNKGLVVLVRKDSAVVVSSWRPALLRPLVKSSIDGDRVSITVKGENQGWATPKLESHGSRYLR